MLLTLLFISFNAKANKPIVCENDNISEANKNLVPCYSKVENTLKDFGNVPQSSCANNPKIDSSSNSNSSTNICEISSNIYELALEANILNVVIKELKSKGYSIQIKSATATKNVAQFHFSHSTRSEPTFYEDLTIVEILLASGRKYQRRYKTNIKLKKSHKLEETLSLAISKLPSCEDLKLIAR